MGDYTCHEGPQWYYYLTGSFLSGSTTHNVSPERAYHGYLKKYRGSFRLRGFAWQTRYFILNPDNGQVLYYVEPPEKNPDNRLFFSLWTDNWRGSFYIRGNTVITEAGKGKKKEIHIKNPGRKRT